MEILSYRGPATAGGVSSTLEKILEIPSHSRKRWWFLESSPGGEKSLKCDFNVVCRVPGEMADAHYRYCNNFLWPVLHDLPEHAIFSNYDRLLYHQFNMKFAQKVLQSRTRHKSKATFVNDYQLALMTGLLNGPDNEMSLFWHIPWPRSVNAESAPYLAEVAEGILGADRIGFHIAEYVANFLQFVDEHLPDYKVDYQRKAILHRNERGRVSELLVCPLGLDVAFWQNEAAQAKITRPGLNIQRLADLPFVLSVDRGDYTKGVVRRLKGIDRFLAEHPERIGEISFVQLCQPSRYSLPAFKSYWGKCRALADEINRRHAVDGWEPIVWIEQPMNATELAWLYKHANAMLITPVRDGLNLTAKEYAICSQDGVLILSPGAGVWHELSDHVLPVDVDSAEHIAEQIQRALSMSDYERRSRLRLLKRKVSANDLQSWWHDFQNSSSQDRELACAGLETVSRTMLA